MARRARTLWRELEQESGAELLSETGVQLVRARRGRLGGRVAARAQGRSSIPAERWSVDDAAQRFPSFDGDDLAWVLHEPEAGRAARAAGGPDARRSRRRRAARARARAGRSPTASYVVVDGEVLEADRVVWSCGGWLASLFPDLVQLRVTRQELFFFDGGPAWRSAPALGRLRPRRPTARGDLDALGVKIAWDSEGPPLDPDADLPAAATEETETLARGYVADRFPALADARLVGTHACRYEISPTRTSSPRRTPEHAVASGSSAAAPATASSTARRWPSGSPRAWDGGAPLPPHFALGERAERRLVQERGLELLTATNHGPSCRTSAAADLRPRARRR